MVKINIAKDFSRYPGGRFEVDGPDSGEKFRGILVSHLKKDEKIEIDLDGTRGYGSSFLEEAFGGLVRCENFESSDLNARLKFKSKDPTLIKEITQYIEQAAVRKSKG